mmetsp:Transcript_39262/g.59921  ORF Transcript_39262/g.59921 Transcript_39262/m.59921 type:complete len:238 (-) Transcript_39262:985-1698(-)
MAGVFARALLHRRKHFLASWFDKAADGELSLADAIGFLPLHTQLEGALEAVLLCFLHKDGLLLGRFHVAVSLRPSVPLFRRELELRNVEAEDRLHVFFHLAFSTVAALGVLAFVGFHNCLFQQIKSVFSTLELPLVHRGHLGGAGRRELELIASEGLSCDVLYELHSLRIHHVLRSVRLHSTAAPLDALNALVDFRILSPRVLLFNLNDLVLFIGILGSPALLEPLRERSLVDSSTH